MMLSRYEEELLYDRERALVRLLIKLEGAVPARAVLGSKGERQYVVGASGGTI